MKNKQTFELDVRYKGDTIKARRTAEPNGSQSGSGPAASPGNLLAMQIIGSSSKSTELETSQ